ncbi:MAG: dynamin family protein [Pseudomonadota bacterium]
MISLAKSLFDRNLVPNAISQQQEQLLGLIRQGQSLATVVADPALTVEIDQLSTGALKPFLFVIVGEVKSGKSSLINALLEVKVCAVDSAPCTAKVQEINFGEEEQRVEVSEFEERLYLPHPILKQIAIVDTPGTNSIIRDHQIITENYIPQSDLVLFVFFAKNPYTGSAWDFLHFIRNDWQRNVLFVLQQCDLIPSEQRKRTLDHIREQLVERGIETPTIFAVSVKTGTGLGALRDYLRHEVVEGRQFTKAQSLLQNLTRFAKGLETLLKNHEKLNQHDEMLLGKLQGLSLNLQTEAEVEKQVAIILEVCRQRVEEASKRLGKRFQNQLSLLDKLDVFKNALVGGREVRQWLAEFFGHVQQDINNVIYQAQLRYFSELHQRAKTLAKQMLEVLANRPKHLKKPGEDAMSRRREQTLNELRQRLAALDDLRPEEAIQPRTALGPINRLLWFYRVVQGLAALILLTLGLYTSGLITGLILGGMGYVGVGYGLFARNRDRLQKQCLAALADSLADLEQRLRANLGEQLNVLQQIGDSVRTAFERDLKDRRNQTGQLLSKTQQLLDSLSRFQAQS